jgi:hypothetical protein
MEYDIVYKIKTSGNIILKILGLTIRYTKRAL